jgi:hypothetical protein
LLLTTLSCASNPFSQSSVAKFPNRSELSSIVPFPLRSSTRKPGASCSPSSTRPDRDRYRRRCRSIRAQLRREELSAASTCCVPRRHRDLTLRQRPTTRLGLRPGPSSAHQVRPDSRHSARADTHLASLGRLPAKLSVCKFVANHPEADCWPRSRQSEFREPGLRLGVLLRPESRFARSSGLGGRLFTRRPTCVSPRPENAPTFGAPLSV